jgi:rhodanese-related sulfurtransferase
MEMANRLKSIPAVTAAELGEQGALLVDIRESNEVARVAIPGAHHAALSSIQQAEIPGPADQAVVFFCASGNRTNTYAGLLAAKANGRDAYIMEGGISGWYRAGLPTRTG